MTRERLPKDLKDEVFEKCGGKCAYCGDDLKKGWHADHVHPVAGGGPDDICNLLPSCSKCNNYKSAWSLEQFRLELQMQVSRARKYSVNFRLAEKYKQITVQEHPIVFYFEKIGVTYDHKMILEMIKKSRI